MYFKISFYFSLLKMAFGSWLKKIDCGKNGTCKTIQLNNFYKPERIGKFKL